MKLLQDTVCRIVPQDRGARAEARARLDHLAMPHWALGRLMDIAEDLAGMTGTIRPAVARRTVVVMAGDHGVASEGVSLFPAAVTPQMVHAFVGGRAGINALARQAAARVVVVDMGVAADLGSLVSAGKIVSRRIGPGTASIARGPAMSREQAIRAVEAGIEVATECAASTDLFGTGDMGIGNTTPSSAIVAAVTRLPAAAVTGRGTGVDDERLRHKAAVVEKALAVNRPDASDGLDLLAKVGGFEIGGLAGLILGAAAARRPVLVDGFISTAAALVADAIAPAAREYMICAHRSVEQGHQAALQRLGKQPLLDLSLRLGEGTGAALAMNLVAAAAAVLTDVATFSEAAVSEATP